MILNLKCIYTRWPHETRKKPDDCIPSSSQRSRWEAAQTWRRRCAPASRTPATTGPINCHGCFLAWGQPSRRTFKWLWRNWFSANLSWSPATSSARRQTAPIQHSSSDSSERRSSNFDQFRHLNMVSNRPTCLRISKRLTTSSSAATATKGLFNVLTVAPTRSSRAATKHSR